MNSSHSKLTDWGLEHLPIESHRAILDVGCGGGKTKLAEKYAPRTGMTLLSVDEHREIFTSAGYANVQVIEEHHKGWICGIGRKPIANS